MKATPISIAMKKWSVSFLLMVQSCFAEMPYWYWYASPEEIASFENGKVATLACPVSVVLFR
jgi:hypothetical protein